MRSPRLLLAAMSLATFATFAQAQTAFTYQGLLTNNNQNASGLYDLRFRLYDAALGGNQVGSTLCADNVQVTGGRFSVSLDFGAVFGGTRYLEIDARQDSGLNCASPAGFVTLGPRTTVTSSPRAIYSNAAGNADTLGGLSPSFFTDAANLTGTLSDSRLSTNVPRLNTASTFSAIPAFNGGTTGSTAPFTVDSSFKVTNLNADLLDGLDSAAFAPVSHTHDAAAINTGTLADARIASNIPRLANANTFTNGQTISITGQFPLTATSTSNGGTWQSLTNTSAGGHEWNFISAGSSNSEGAGKLLIRDGTATSVRMTFDTDGDVGIGTSTPAGKLDLTGADPRLAIRNANDQGGGYIQQSFGTLQLGLYNPGASAWFGVPAGGFRAGLGVESTGRVGSLTNTGLSPSFRNILDDGSGNASFQGRVTAPNMPAVVYSTFGGSEIISNDSRTLLETITANVPADGFILITCRCSAYAVTVNNSTWSNVYLELKETTVGETLTKDSVLSCYPVGNGASPNAIISDITFTHMMQVSAGVRRFKVRIRHSGQASGQAFGGEITITYFPRSM